MQHTLRCCCCCWGKPGLSCLAHSTLMLPEKHKPPSRVRAGKGWPVSFPSLRDRTINHLVPQSRGSSSTDGCRQGRRIQFPDKTAELLAQEHCHVCLAEESIAARHPLIQGTCVSHEDAPPRDVHLPTYTSFGCAEFTRLTHQS